MYVLAAALLVLALPACLESVDPIQPVDVIADGDFDIRVTTQTQFPSYEWAEVSEPNARRLTVRVEEAGVDDGSQTGEIMLDIIADDPALGFEGPVNHEDLPEGARYLTQPIPLIFSSRYRVTIELVDEDEAWRKFSPDDPIIPGG